MTRDLPFALKPKNEVFLILVVELSQGCAVFITVCFSTLYSDSECKKNLPQTGFVLKESCDRRQI